METTEHGRAALQRQPDCRARCRAGAGTAPAAAVAAHAGLAGRGGRIRGAAVRALRRRTHVAPLGAVLTAVTAGWSAFTLAVPGRSRAWAWLPLPPALLWIGASGLGCLRNLRGLLAPDTSIATLHQSADCLVFIVSFSIPLSALMVWLLRRACPLRPLLTALLVGLASAAASASLLEICHA